MKLPNAEQAIIDIAKLRDYCLNPNHPEGRHKARVFKSALGLEQSDAEWLAREIARQITLIETCRAEHTSYGWRYDVDMKIVRNDRVAVIRTGWIVRHTENVPRLSTCFAR